MAGSAPSPDPGFHALSFCQHQEKCRGLKHILFSAWPDHQTPESAAPLLRLVAEVEESPETAANTGPIVVHCRYAPPSRAASKQAPPPLPLGLSWNGSRKDNIRQAQFFPGWESLGHSARYPVFILSFMQNLAIWAGHSDTTQRGDRLSESFPVCWGGR